VTILSSLKVLVLETQQVATTSLLVNVRAIITPLVATTPSLVPLLVSVTQVATTSLRVFVLADPIQGLVISSLVVAQVSATHPVITTNSLVFG
jgi:hypothetical protein